MGRSTTSPDLKFMAAGKALPWRRDLLDMFAFHLTVPAGVSSLDVKFDFLISARESGYSSGASSTAYLNDLSWNQVIVYPRGFAAKDLMYLASLKLPADGNSGRRSRAQNRPATRSVSTLRRSALWSIRRFWRGVFSA